MSQKTININIPVLARVEGEGALDLKIENNQITDLKLRIYEPPRYFEKILEGRNYYDVPDTVARICGICPVAYQMSAAHAIESIFDVPTTPWIRTMRRLYYCGEWIQSHSLHIHLLAAPDYLGFNSALEMAQQYLDEVTRGFKLQSLGCVLVALTGARSVHPVGSVVGGFTRAPDKESVAKLLKRVTEAKQDAIELIEWLDTLDLPEDNQDFVSVALHHDNEYPFNEGRIISDNGLDIRIDEFEQHFTESQIDHSTALHCLLNGQPYLVGPLARVNLNKTLLPEEVKQAMQGLKAQFPSKNMFHSMIARAIEIYFALLEAENVLTNYEMTDQPCMPVEPKAGTGFGCTEAPRGLLWHRYEMDESGCVKNAIIIPPTSQNQPRIEQDLRDSLINFGLGKPKESVRLHAEKVIRNYDPCISCSTHFLNLNMIRDGVVEQSKHNETMFIPKDVDLSRVAIIGIGSPHNGDDLGWQMIDQLLQNRSMISLREEGLKLFKLDRPGTTLLEQIKPYDHVFIIDAIKSDNPDQSFICIDASQLISNEHQISSHEVGVLESVVLMESLQLTPEQLVIFGINNINDVFIEKIINMFKERIIEP